MSVRAPGLAVAMLLSIAPAAAWGQVARNERARSNAIHPVTSHSEMQVWLARVPETRHFPPDFSDVLRGQAPAFVIEMTTTQACIPCADLWARLKDLQRH